jgi:hypothetical protein
MEKTARHRKTRFTLITTENKEINVPALPLFHVFRAFSGLPFCLNDNNRE